MSPFSHLFSYFTSMKLRLSSSFSKPQPPSRGLPQCKEDHSGALLGKLKGHRQNRNLSVPWGKSNPKFIKSALLSLPLKYTELFIEAALAWEMIKKNQDSNLSPPQSRGVPSHKGFFLSSSSLIHEHFIEMVFPQKRLLGKTKSPSITSIWNKTPVNSNNYIERIISINRSTWTLVWVIFK